MHGFTLGLELDKLVPEFSEPKVMENSGVTLGLEPHEA